MTNVPENAELTYSSVVSARDHIAGQVVLTPVRQFEALDAALGCQLFLKCEQLQPTGAFKLRGATHAIARLRQQGNTADVATHSSGNHGAALAWAASRDGRQARVVMPSNAVPAKLAAVRRFGGEVILCEPNQAAREAGLEALVADGLVPIPPYDHPDIIAGQGTAALELLETVTDLDDIITPTGGGGLLAGTALAVSGLRPGIRVYGAEPDGAADAHASFRSGERVEKWTPDTVCDGLRSVIGALNFEIIQAHVQDILLTSDEATEAAMRQLHDLSGLVVEPSAAVTLAAIATHPDRFAGRKVGVVLSGGNVDFELLPWLEDDA